MSQQKTKAVDPNGPIIARIYELRTEIAAKKEIMGKVEDAPIGEVEAIARAEQFIEKLAAEGAKSLGYRLSAIMHPQNQATQNSLVGPEDGEIIIFLLRENLHKAAHEILSNKYKDVSMAFGQKERVDKIKELVGEIYGLEKEEEDHICELENIGRFISRRHDVCAEVLIGIELGATVPWNWHSPKVERLLMMREMHDAGFRAARDNYTGLRDQLFEMKSWRRDHTPLDETKDKAKIEEKKIALTEEKMNTAKKIMEELQEVLVSAIASADAVGTYLETHKQNTPTGNDHAQNATEYEMSRQQEVPVTRDEVFPDWFLHRSF